MNTENTQAQEGNPVYNSLRLEARPIELAKMQENQVDAFEQILTKIGDAVKMLNSRDDSNNASSPGVNCDEANPNQIVFLSGGRGSGKTSLLLTLKKLLNFKTYRRECYELDDESKEKGKNPARNIEAISRNCRRLSSRLIWLDTLDLEPLPGPVNLLAGILSRIERSISLSRERGPLRASRGGGRSSLESLPDYQQVMMELQHLQRDVTLAWEGNLLQQASNLDSDVFAAEVFRAERSRLELNTRFRNVLKDLSCEILHTDRLCSPMFILPIDDFDLSPQRCIELLRLIRMVSAPHLFTIILGDMEIARGVFNLKMSGELSSINGRPGDASSTRRTHNPLFSRVNEISSNAVRKLIPPSHIVELKRQEIENVFGYKYDSTEKSIEKLLAAIPVQINSAAMVEEEVCKNDKAASGDNDEEKKRSGKNEKEGINAGTGYYDHKKQHVANKRITNLAAFLNAGNIVKIEDREKIRSDAPPPSCNIEHVYCARKFFRLPFRHLQDLWLHLVELNHTLASKPGEEKKKSCNRENDKNFMRKGVELADKLFREAAREDRHLTLDQCENLLRASSLDFEGEYQFDTTGLHAENVIGPHFQFLLEGRSIVAHLAKDWLISVIDKQMYEYKEILPDNNNDSKRRETYWKYSKVQLEDRTMAAVVFLHDLLALKRPNNIVDESLIHKIDKKEWVYAKWDFGGSGAVKIPWLAPPWTSFWEHDFLRRGWNDICLWLRYHEATLYSIFKNTSGISCFLAYAWIKMGTIILGSEKDGEDSDVPNDFYILRLPRTKFLDQEWNQEWNPGSRSLVKEEVEFLKTIERLEITGWVDELPHKFMDNLRKEDASKETKEELVKKFNCIICEIHENLKNYLEEVKVAPEKIDKDSLCTDFEKIRSRLVEDLRTKIKTDIEEDFLGMVPEVTPRTERYWKKFLALAPPLKYWLELVEQVYELADLALENDKPGYLEKNHVRFSPRRRELIHGWLARVACMLAPESGISPRVTMLFFLKKNRRNPLLNFWMNLDIARKIRTIRAKSAARFFDLEAFRQAARIFSPQPRHAMRELTKEFDQWANKVDVSNSKNNEMTLNWSYKYEIRRFAMNILGNEILCPIFEEIKSLSGIKEKREECDYKKSHRIDNWEALGLPVDGKKSYMKRANYHEETKNQKSHSTKQTKEPLSRIEK